jgi:hypothetical protein
MSRVTCPRCQKPTREISVSEASKLFEKLGPFLSVVPSWGCYVPSRPPDGSAGRHESWPLHAWGGPGTCPLVLEWSEEGDRPTFLDFCRAYGLDPIAEDEKEAIEALAALRREGGSEVETITDNIRRELAVVQAVGNDLGLPWGNGR